MFEFPAFSGLWEELLHDTAWFNRAYLYDWGVTFVLLLFVQAVKHSPVFERKFSLDDPVISYPPKHDQVPAVVNQYISAIFPLVFSGFLGVLNKSSHEVHHGLLAGWSGIQLNALITGTLKNRIGRLRPDFLSRCAWDATLKACTGRPSEISGGRRSFPSGHSSSAFAGLGFIFLLLAGKTGVFSFNRSTPGGAFRRSRLVLLLFTLSPLFLATWIAITRLEDHKHHKEDIIVGSLIGISCAFTTYSIYWHNPFSSELSAKGLVGQPRVVYDGDHSGPSLGETNDQFELTDIDDDEESVLYDRNTEQQNLNPHTGQRGRGRGRRGGRGRR